MADDATNALRALRNIVNVLGPSVPSSVTDEGARYEWDRALRYAREGVAAAQALTQQRDDAERRAATLSRMLEERTFPAAIELTESMVERGLRWYWPHDKEYADNQRDFMRRFLCAALATAQPRVTPEMVTAQRVAIDELAQMEREREARMARLAQPEAERAGGEAVAKFRVYNDSTKFTLTTLPAAADLPDGEYRLFTTPRTGAEAKPEGVDANVEAVRARLLERSTVGLAKYGVSTERDDLTPAQWLRHLQEELMDAAVYIEAITRQAQGGGEETP